MSRLGAIATVKAETTVRAILPMKVLRVLPILALSFLTLPSAKAQEGLKIFISIDMEGLTGVVTDAQLGPSGFEYERF